MIGFVGGELPLILENLDGSPLEVRIDYYLIVKNGGLLFWTRLLRTEASHPT